MHLLDEADAVRIDTLAVRPASRGSGFAGALLGVFGGCCGSKNST